MLNAGFDERPSLVSLQLFSSSKTKDANVWADSRIRLKLCMFWPNCFLNSDLMISCLSCFTPSVRHGLLQSTASHPVHVWGPGHPQHRWAAPPSHRFPPSQIHQRNQRWVFLPNRADRELEGAMSEYKTLSSACPSLIPNRASSVSQSWSFWYGSHSAVTHNPNPQINMYNLVQWAWNTAL